MTDWLAIRPIRAGSISLKDDAPPTNRVAPDGRYFDVVKPEYAADLKPIADLAKEIMAGVEARR